MDYELRINEIINLHKQLILSTDVLPEFCTYNLETLRIKQYIKILTYDFMVMVFCQMGIIEILPLILQNCLPFGSADFTASAALQIICSSTLSATVLWRTCPAPCICGKLDACKIQV